MGKQKWRFISIAAIVACVVMVAIAAVTEKNNTAAEAMETEESSTFASHVEMAKKYLEELAYEQAIAEYMAALEIEPDNQEIQDALEQIYLDMAQQYMDELQYENAIDILNAGYDLLHRETLYEKKGNAEWMLALWEEEMRIQEENHRQEEERRNEEAEKEKQAEQRRIEREEAKRKAEEEVFGDNGDAPEIAALKRDVADFLFSIINEQWEGYEEYSYVRRIEVKEDNNRLCRMIVAIASEKLLDCYEVEITKETGEIIVVDYYGGEIMEDGKLYLYDGFEDHYHVVGRSSQ